MTSFEQAKEVLKRCFGYDGFRPEQERAIKAIMGKRDVLAVMSTGAGKSLIYQVPAVALAGHLHRGLSPSLAHERPGGETP